MELEAIVFRHLDWLMAIVLFMIGWYFGTRAERRHLATLADDEHRYRHITVSSERFYEPPHASESMLVVGSVVIAQDYFKTVVARVLSLFGKNLTVYESLLERARREAVVRAKSQAASGGFCALYGLRFEMTEVDGGIEMLAYAVAVRQMTDLENHARGAHKDP